MGFRSLTLILALLASSFASSLASTSDVSFSKAPAPGKSLATFTQTIPGIHSSVSRVETAHDSKTVVVVSPTAVRTQSAFSSTFAVPPSSKPIRVSSETASRISAATTSSGIIHTPPRPSPITSSLSTIIPSPPYTQPPSQMSSASLVPPPANITSSTTVPGGPGSSTSAPPPPSNGATSERYSTKLLGEAFAVILATLFVL